MEYLANRICVTFTRERTPTDRRVTCLIDRYGHIDVISAQGGEHANDDQRDWLVDEGIAEIRQVDGGPSYEPFLTDKWEDALDEQLAALKGWQP